MDQLAVYYPRLLHRMPMSAVGIPIRDDKFLDSD
jgi:hypothetical protein